MWGTAVAWNMCHTEIYLRSAPWLQLAPVALAAVHSECLIVNPEMGPEYVYENSGRMYEVCMSR